MKNVFEYRRSLKDLLKIKNDLGFQKFFIEYSIKQYFSLLKLKEGKILVLGANDKEVKTIPNYPFSKIVLFGITKPSKDILDLIKKDKRVSYLQGNIESLPFEEKSFDLVFCKESLHHLARPVLGLYEILRVCERAVIFIEPNETFIGNIFEKLGLSSIYERNHNDNFGFRDNFVYRWGKKEIEKILNSYYLDSGWKLHLTSCWLSNSSKIMKSRFKNLFLFLGWLLSFLPFSKGNYLNCLIIPGKNIPPNIKR